MKKLKFVVVGAGGYGLVHLNAIEWLEKQGLAELSGIVALKIDQQKNPALIESLKNRGVKIYSHIDEFFINYDHDVDVLTVPIGIHMHVPVSKKALEAGLHVYCEKPLAATVQEVDELIAAQEKTNQKITVGFQHIYSNSMQQLKARICDGRLGPVKEASLMCGWTRSIQYYSRNDWAGKLRKDNHWILDSPANNAHSHYLLNMLYLCSTQTGEAAIPSKVRAELYRANKIESPDTVQVEFKTNEGNKGHVILSHCNASENGPVMNISCKYGEVEWKGDIGRTVIKYKNGEEEVFDNIIHDQWRYEGFKNLIDSINNDAIPICTPKMARCQTLAVNAIHESCPEIKQIPDEYVLEEEDWEIFPPDTKGYFLRAKNMDAYLEQAFTSKKFLSELKIPWAEQINSNWFEVGDYNYFPISKAFK